MSAHVLPDSRLHNRNFGAVVVEWANPDGSTERVEMLPVFCANCGKHWGFCPKENMTFAFWLCRKCYERYGAIAGTYSVPEARFNAKLHEEMQARFGRDLSTEELAILADAMQLPRELELLARESPYKG